jgi:hypothetical protein
MNDIPLQQLRALADEDYQKNYDALGEKLTQAGYSAALIALPFSRREITGFRKNEVTPAHAHEVNIAFRFYDHRLALEEAGENPDVVIAGALLHDVPEKWAKHKGYTTEVMKQQLVGAPNPDMLVADAFALSKYRDGKKLPAPSYYAELLLVARRFLIKLGDRGENIRTILELPDEKQPGYVRNTELLMGMSSQMHILHPQFDAVTRSLEREIQEPMHTYLRFAQMIVTGRGHNIAACLDEEGLLERPFWSKEGTAPAHTSGVG